MRSQVRLDRRIGLPGGLTRSDAGADHDRDRGSQRVGRIRHARRIDAGDRDRRLVPDAAEDRAGTDRADAGRQPRLVAQRLLAVGGRLGVPFGEPIDRDRAVRRPTGWPAASRSPSSRRAPLPRTCPSGRHARASCTRRVKRVLPRSDTVSAGVSGIPVARVGDDDHVGAERVGVVGEELRERPGTGLLLPLDEQSDAEVEVISQRRPSRAQRCDMRHDSGLVVRGAAAVQAAAADGRRERRGLPQRLVADRLHVVVGVEQDGRASVACRARREDCGLTDLFRAGDRLRAGSRRSRTGRAPRTRAATASALRCTALASNPGNAIDGMRTRAPRSARAVGMPEAAASRTAS